MLLDGKIILITGASRGIGQATAVQLAKEGARVIIHGRSKESLTETKNQIEHLTSYQPFEVIYDVRDESEMRFSFQQIKKQFGYLDGIVNNAGIMHEALSGMLPKESLQEMLDVNVIGVLNHIQLASRLMLKQKKGSIVNISSIIGTNGAEGSVGYSATKAAVVGISRSAAKELGERGIRVNAIAPGFINTDLTKHYEGYKKEKVLSKITMNRFGQAEEIANVIVFLMSDLSSYVTGQVIGVDGGMVI
ncbi:SDR family NAD(P)-dependent oxidoreductase [Ornithinibacillus contaminans]|uniref:SDR family NAD(P)-dependent oxidoreductase n=1 Tax=Ornithinibacillus contaminans TaxID=694055 RepID=UPI00064DB8BC|nr:SDR family NAD(P)-dependent oxidoreductase [Ornithinibacillus contaminans]